MASTQRLVDPLAETLTAWRTDDLRGLRHSADVWLKDAERVRMLEAIDAELQRRRAVQ